ncbi:hypothetical protein [Clostridium weizhouense]|uniref:Uncharacterized protein n=1 Tax=Clostridium weizhouense TaxID=2859781 RepID=A0ABS7AIG7_9CLOT|nr:hypothetical protein [Clostridium weizhouense]MBW6408467.1 hypothetical protein [Clostridium weizhouense]
MYNLMLNLIINKYYSAMEEAVKKLKVFFAIDDLTQEQLVELVELAREKYEVKKEEKLVEKQVETVNTNVETKAEEVKTEVTQ